MKILGVSLMSISAAVLLVGCGEQESSKSTSSTPASQPKPAEPVEQVKQVVADAANTAVAEAKKEVQAVVATLSQKLIDSTKGGATDELLKKISVDLESRVNKLTASVAEAPAVTAAVDQGVEALLGNKDADAVGALTKLTSVNLTPEQSSLAKDVYNAAAAFVTQRNFSSLEGSSSDVNQLVNSVWKGDYSAALQPLQNIYSKASLTTEQKNLLSKTVEPYLPEGWSKASGAVNEGLNTLKKFGL